MYHAWYSESAEKQYNENGSTANIYLSEEGQEIRITEVVQVKMGDKPGSKWKDLEYRGIVTKWVRLAEPIIDKDEFEQARACKQQREREERLMMYRGRF